MEAVEAVGGSTSAPRPLPQPIGVTAELAEARSRLRQSAGPDRWEAVLAEVTRLQSQEHLSPLDAMQAVLARLAAGWQPPIWRSTL